MANKKPTQKSSKSIVKKPKVSSATVKQRKLARYKSFRLQKRIKHPGPRLPSWWTFIKKAYRLMLANKKPLAVYFLVYLLLNILLVRGFGSPVDIPGLREDIAALVDEQTAGLAASFTVFGVLLQSGTSTESQVSQVYQFLLLVISSLAIIWLYRQQQAGNNVSMKQAFYRGMFPFIPFVLVLLVMTLQLVPLLISNFLFQQALGADLIVNAFEMAVWIVLVFLTLLLSLYMLAGSTVALYIVTLPEMTPMQALREARELVRFRRASIIARIVILIIAILVGLFVLVVPVIYFAPGVAEWLFFALTLLIVPFVHGYMFSLYRELL